MCSDGGHVAYRELGGTISVFDERILAYETNAESYHHDRLEADLSRDFRIWTENIWAHHVLDRLDRAMAALVPSQAQALG